MSFHLPTLQPVQSCELQPGVTEADESALEPQEELEKEKQAQRETSAKLTQVCFQHQHTLTP